MALLFFLLFLFVSLMCPMLTSRYADFFSENKRKIELTHDGVSHVFLSRIVYTGGTQQGYCRNL